jgi:hypothetical protein
LAVVLGSSLCKRSAPRATDSVVERLKGWLQRCGAQAGDERGERLWTAAALHPSVEERVAQAPEAARPVPRRTAPLLGALAAVQAQGARDGRGRTRRGKALLTHLATKSQARLPQRAHRQAVLEESGRRARRRGRRLLRGSKLGRGSTFGTWGRRAVAHVCLCAGARHEAGIGVEQRCSGEGVQTRN